MNRYEIHLGNCLEVLKGIPDNSVDSIVTDPPYGLAFMGKKWDYDVPEQAIWQECLRVLKPGGHLLAFAGTRTQHRMAVRIEDAGFEIRDMIAWVYGSGFPKSMDVSKAIDKAAGAVREVVGFDAAKATQQTAKKGTQAYGDFNGQTGLITEPATDAARQWEGWGTALKPAIEPITVARKPFKGTVAANVLAHSTGALNIDGCRVRMSDGEKNPSIARYASTKQQGNNGWGHVNRGARFDDSAAASAALGRWPANLIHDGSYEPTELLGDAARFFYCAKTSRKDRGEGNTHPTVKPTDLMAYLCRLVTPPGGVVLDPFMGSGSTGKAAMREGFHFIGIEMDADYLAIAEARIAHEAGKERTA